ncbi:MAG TPA: LCP family protein [Pilimelia sp.]|nr:LCP family protein [Pilimelia sp.]
MAKAKRTRAPLWARLCTVFGATLMLVSGVTLVGTEALLARYEGAVTEDDLFGDEAAAAPEAASDITGPLNVLLVGIDRRERVPTWVPKADSIMIMHIPAELDRAYLFSLPRDLLVDIPRFDKAGFRGGRDKLTHAMAHGSNVPGSTNKDAARGFELLANTVSEYTGIARFEAGAIINFNGFKKIVDAMGGVTMHIDQNVESIHMRPDGKPRRLIGGAEGPNAYTGPRAKYVKGTRHLAGWQALDYVRQRYIPGADYARQRHQQQFIRAMASQALSKDVAKNPRKLDAVIRAAGESLVFNGRGRSPVEFAFALRGLSSEAITMVKLPGGGEFDGDDYIGERLEPVAAEFFAALRGNTVDQFLLARRELINATS